MELLVTNLVRRRGGLEMDLPFHEKLLAEITVIDRWIRRNLKRSGCSITDDFRSPALLDNETYEQVMSMTWRDRRRVVKRVRERRNKAVEQIHLFQFTEPNRTMHGRLLSFDPDESLSDG